MVVRWKTRRPSNISKVQYISQYFLLIFLQYIQNISILQYFSILLITKVPLYNVSHKGTLINNNVNFKCIFQERVE